MMMTKKEWLNLAERAAWTFLQAAAGAFIIAPDMNWKAMIVGAVGAGLSAIKTLIIDFAKKRLEQKDESDA